MIICYLRREIFHEDFTLGSFVVNEDSKVILKLYTCEDAVRGDGDAATVVTWKIKGKSAIPYGVYNCALTDSLRFGRKVWEVLAVPGFQGIRIHAGNTSKDTEGCLLLGTHVLPTRCGVGESRVAVAQFESLMASRNNSPFQLKIYCNKLD